MELTLICRRPSGSLPPYGVDLGPAGDDIEDGADDIWTEDGHLHVPKVDRVPTGGDQAQCGYRATFEALGPTQAAENAIEEGWIVDDVTRGESSREDTCPWCNDYGKGGFWRNGPPRNPAEPVAWAPRAVA